MLELVKRYKVYFTSIGILLYATMVFMHPERADLLLELSPHAIVYWCGAVLAMILLAYYAYAMKHHAHIWGSDPEENKYTYYFSWTSDGLGVVMCSIYLSAGVRALLREYIVL